MKLFTIPNLLTLSNLLCGCISIVCSVNGHFHLALLWILIGMVFDFTDGFVARLLRQSSPIGLQLDSLADLVTFGVAPSISLFYAVHRYFAQHIDDSFALLAFLIAAFSALRLAKFNVDTRQTDSFIGLATPANALLIAPVALLIERFTLFQDLSVTTITTSFLLLIVGSCYFLISEIPMFSLKVKSLKLSENLVRYLFLLLAIILLLIGSFYALPLIIILYISVSILIYLQRK